MTAAEGGGEHRREACQRGGDGGLGDGRDVGEGGAVAEFVDDAGGADGVMGQKTKNAIMAFQTDNGMKATGEVDEKLVKALLARK